MAVVFTATRTLDDVRACLERDRKKRNKCDITMARLMVKHGNLTDEARAFAQAWLDNDGYRA